jgi:hypothetical protein
VMTEFDVLDIVGNGIKALRLRHDPLRRRSQSMIAEQHR